MIPETILVLSLLAPRQVATEPASMCQTAVDGWTTCLSDLSTTTASLGISLDTLDRMRFDYGLAKQAWDVERTDMKRRLDNSMSKQDAVLLIAISSVIGIVLGAGGIALGAELTKNDTNP